MKQKEMLQEKRKQQLEELGWDESDNNKKGETRLNFEKSNKNKKKVKRFKSLSGLGEGLYLANQFTPEDKDIKTKD